MRFYDAAWIQDLQSALNADDAWREAARYFRGRLELRHDKGATTIAIMQGTATVTGEADPMGADIIVAGPDSEWSRLLEGRIDWFEGLSPGLGELTLSGNAVAAWRDVQVMAMTFNIISRVNHAPDSVEPSPPPKPSGDHLLPCRMPGHVDVSACT